MKKKNGRPFSRFTPETLAIAIERVKNGEPLSIVAKDNGVCRKTIDYHCAKVGVKSKFNPFAERIVYKTAERTTYRRKPYIPTKYDKIIFGDGPVNQGKDYEEYIQDYERRRSIQTTH